MFAHYTAKALGNLVPFADDTHARWMWKHLRRAFPVALAVTLMPDHPHMIAPAGHDEAFVRVLTAFSRRFGFGRLWQPTAGAQLVATPDKLARSVRYAALNPSRPSGYQSRRLPLVDDPLRWPWSTHRDAVGCVVHPWVTAAQLQSELGWGAADFTARFHRYVTSDPRVQVDGTPMPSPAKSSRLPSGSLEAIRRATLAATRAPPDHLRTRTPTRRLFVHLAYRQGWRYPTEIARITNLYPDSVSRIAAGPIDPAALHAAVLCLGDARLRDGFQLRDEPRDGPWLLGAANDSPPVVGALPLLAANAQ